MRGLESKTGCYAGLHCRDVNCRWTFLALFNVEAHFLTFVQCLVTITSDGCVVDKYVLTAIFRSDKAKTFRRIKPLNCTSTQDNTLYIKNNKRAPVSSERVASVLHKPCRKTFPFTMTFHTGLTLVVQG